MRYRRQRFAQSVVTGRGIRRRVLHRRFRQSSSAARRVRRNHQHGRRMFEARKTGIGPPDSRWESVDRARIRAARARSRSRLAQARWKHRDRSGRRASPIQEKIPAKQADLVAIRAVRASSRRHPIHRAWRRQQRVLRISPALPGFDGTLSAHSERGRQTSSMCSTPMEGICGHSTQSTGAILLRIWLRRKRHAQRRCTREDRRHR